MDSDDFGSSYDTSVASDLTHGGSAGLGPSMYYVNDRLPDTLGDASAMLILTLDVYHSDGLSTGTGSYNTQSAANNWVIKNAQETADTSDFGISTIQAPGDIYPNCVPGGSQNGGWSYNDCVDYSEGGVDQPSRCWGLPTCVFWRNSAVVTQGCPQSEEQSTTQFVCGDGQNWLRLAACHRYDFGYLPGSGSPALQGGSAQTVENAQSTSRVWSVGGGVSIPINPVLNLSFSGGVDWTGQSSVTEKITPGNYDSSGSQQGDLNSFFFMANPLGTSSQSYNPVSGVTYPPMIFAGPQLPQDSFPGAC